MSVLSFVGIVPIQKVVPVVWCSSSMLCHSVTHFAVRMGGGSLDGQGAPRPMPGNDRRVVRREGSDVGIDAVPRAEGGPQLLGAGEGDLLWAGAEVSVARGLGQPM